MKRYSMSRVIGMVLLCVALFGAHGCNSAKEPSISQSNAPKSKEYLYGEGSGPNFDLAKQNALQDLATNLQVSIKYSASQNISQKNDTLQTSGMTNTFLESKIKDIPSVEVEKTTKQGNKVNVRVRVSRDVLEGSFANRITQAQSDLSAMLKTCNQVSFSQYKKFKRVLNELKADVALYQALTTNMSYGSAMLLEFQNMISLLPSYAIKWELDDLYNYQQETQAVIAAELSKFIKIDPEAKQTLHVKINNDNPLHFLLEFYDCKNNLESAIHINTHANQHDILQGSKKSRLGAIIYKTINDKH